MPQPNSNEIKERAHALGFDKVGIVRATTLDEEGAYLRAWIERGFHGEMGYMARDAEKRIDPHLLLPSAQSVVVVALNYYRPEAHSDDQSIGKISRYAWGDDYHEVLRDKLQALLAWISEREPSTEGRICVDSSPAMDKVWAERAGLGWIGKHTNVITEEFGSWVFLGELLLSLELQYDEHTSPDLCGSCTMCIEACPTGAIVAPYQLDARRCISYGTIELREDELPELIRSNLDNWVFGCDICQDVCPWSKFSKVTNEPRFSARQGITSPQLAELADMSDEQFATRFRKSAIKRTKARGLRRNASAALDNNDKES